VRPLTSLITLLVAASLNAGSLDPATSRAWETYIESATGRMEQRVVHGKTFLWVDEVPDRLAKVRSGACVKNASGGAMLCER
jgi:hypothetical protein